MMNSKKLCCVICCLFTMATYAQSNRIAVSAYVAENCGVPANSQKVLHNKLSQLITSCGFAGEINQRFILTAKVDVLTEDVTPTAPPMYAYTLSFNLYIGDGTNGTLFSSAAVEAKGVGNTKDKAYVAALKALNPKDPAIKTFVEEGKEKIIEYYTKECPSILKKAETLASQQLFASAIWELNGVPNICADCYDQAMNLISKIYQTSIDQEGAQMLAEAKSAWNAAQDRAAADKAGTLLARINPQSSAYKEAQTLSSQIASRVKALDEREWKFELKIQQDQTDIRKAKIKAARDVAVAWAENQPKTVYKIYWW